MIQRCNCPCHTGDGCWDRKCNCPEHYGGECSGFIPLSQQDLSVIPDRGMSYHAKDGTEIGSIVIRPEHIAFVAGNWCKQISRKAKHIEIVNLAREHQEHIEKLSNLVGEGK